MDLSLSLFPTHMPFVSSTVCFFVEPVEVLSQEAVDCGSTHIVTFFFPFVNVAYFFIVLFLFFMIIADFWTWMSQVGPTLVLLNVEASV